MNNQKKEKPSRFGRLLFAEKDVERHTDYAVSSVAASRNMRAKVVFKRYALLLIIGGAYLIFCRTTGLSLPCPFHALTGLDCPGCGITRLMLALAEGDLNAAFHANEALFMLGPPLLIFLLHGDIHWILQNERKDPPRAFVIFLLAAFAIFTVWRNFLR